MIFETARLFVRPLDEKDKQGFYELMSHPNIIQLVPQAALSVEESEMQLHELIELEKSTSTKIWALCKKGEDDLIGFCGVLKNDANEDEIAYRLLEKNWNQGYGTEITKALIDYCFVELKSELVTADVWINNVRSLKIVNKFFSLQKEFFNSVDQCVDKRFVLSKKLWLEQQAAMQ